MLVILLLATLAVAYAAWRNPEHALGWFPLAFPLYVLRTSMGPLPTTALELAFDGLILGVTLKRKQEVWISGWKNLSAWRGPIVAWTVTTLIAVFVSPNHLQAFGLWRAYVLEPLIFFVLLHAFLKDELRRTITRSLILTLIVIAGWSIFQFLTNIGIPHPWNVELTHRRATGPFPFPNAVALYGAPLAALCFAWLFETEDKRWKWWLATGFGSGLLATLLAKSIGGLLGLSVACLITLLLKKNTRRWVIATLMIGGIIFAATPSIREPVIKNLTFQDWSGRVRIWMWQDTYRMLKDRPLFGAGFGAYATVFKPYQSKSFIEIFQYPHNILLNLWSETGLLGLLAFTWIIFTWIKLALRPGRKNLAPPPTTNYQLQTTNYLFLIPLLVILIHGLVDVPYFKNDLAFIFWTLAWMVTVPWIRNSEVKS
jgi:putative inorganic carbon (hco3(-)) transporter